MSILYVCIPMVKRSHGFAIVVRIIHFSASIFQMLLSANVKGTCFGIAQIDIVSVEKAS